jgi:hypothetical protein
LGSVKTEGQWAVLLLDAVTTQIMTNICGVADLLEYGISRKKQFYVCAHQFSCCTHLAVWLEARKSMC